MKVAGLDVPELLQGACMRSEANDKHYTYEKRPVRSGNLIINLQILGVLALARGAREGLLTLSL